MDARFAFQVIPSINLVRITMSGLFTQDDIRLFLEARDKAHAQLLCGANQHFTINDVRGMKIQLQSVVADFQKMLGAPEYRSRRLAFVVGPTLTRSQLLRALASRDTATTRCFSEAREAEAWLFENEIELVPRRRANG